MYFFPLFNYFLLYDVTTSLYQLVSSSNMAILHSSPIRLASSNNKIREYNYR